MNWPAYTLCLITHTDMKRLAAAVIIKNDSSSSAYPLTSVFFLKLPSWFHLLSTPFVDNWNNPTDAQLRRALQPIRGWQPSAAGTANYTSASDQRSRSDHRHGDWQSDPACHQHPGNHAVANQAWTAGDIMHWCTNTLIEMSGGATYTWTSHKEFKTVDFRLHCLCSYSSVKLKSIWGSIWCRCEQWKSYWANIVDVSEKNYRVKVHITFQMDELRADGPLIVGPRKHPFIELMRLWSCLCFLSLLQSLHVHIALR